MTSSKTGQPPTFDLLLQRLARVVGHGDEDLVLVRLIDLIDGADVGCVLPVDGAK